jgi:serine/threonine protein kinase
MDEVELINNEYKLVSKIGNGSFGSVWRCVSVKTGKIYAAKIEAPEVVASQVRKEVRVLKDMHGAIGFPELFWDGFIGNQYSMIIELLGKDLRRYLKENKVFCLMSTMTLMG